MPKSLTLLGANSGINPNTGMRGAETTVVPAVVETSLQSSTSGTIFRLGTGSGHIDVTIDGFTIDGHNASLTGGRTLNGVEVHTGAGIVNSIGSFDTNPGAYDVTMTVHNNIIQNLERYGVLADNVAARPAVTGTDVSFNKIDNLPSGNNFGGGRGRGIAFEENVYGSATYNVIRRVNVGWQDDNNNLASPGAGTLIDHNTIHTYHRGIFHNLQYQSATAATISNNTIFVEASGASTTNFGIELSSIANAVGATVSNNDVTGTVYGILLWNLPSTGSITVSGGTLTGNQYGVFATSNDPQFGAAAASHSTISGISIINPTVAGIVIDNSANFAATALAITGGTSVSGGPIGLEVTGPNTSITGDTLNNTSFAGQTSSYVDLVGGASFGKTINATGVSFDGHTGATASLAQNFAIEDKIVHAVDNNTLGFIRVKAGNVLVTPSSGSIQRGVDAASANDTVHVAAGTYTEDVDVNQVISLLGEQSGISPASPTRIPANEAIIQPVSGAGITLSVNDITVSGFTIRSGGGGIQGIATLNTQSGLHIEQNIIHGFASLGIVLGAAANDNFIIDNEVYNNYAGIYLAAGSSGNTIEGNLVHDHVLGGPPDAGSGIVLEGNNTFNQISDNIVRDNNTGFYVFNFGGYFSGTVISCNQIFGNTVGFNNTNTLSTVINAQYNWWGSASGPTHPANAGGTGDSIIEAVPNTVDYHPFLLTPQCVGGLVITGAPATQAPGISFNITVTAIDPVTGLAAADYTGTVQFTSSDTPATLPASYTFNPMTDAGTHTFSITLFSSGNRTITVTDTGTPAFTGTVSVLVNGPPIAVDDNYSVNENGFLVVSTSGPLGYGVLSNDTDPDNDPLSAVVVTNPANGALLLLPNGSFVYVPNTGFAGSDSFTYRANDGISNSNIAAASITVAALPVANNDTFSVAQDSILGNTFDVLANDTPSTGLSIASTTTPGHGSVMINGGADLTYTPAPGFSGTDSFDYTVVNGSGGRATATVIVNVVPANSPPVINAPNSATLLPNQFLALSGITVNDTDAGSGQLLVTLSASNGTLTLGTLGGLIFSPGSDGSADSTMTFTGTLPSINAALAGLTYTQPMDSCLPDTVTIFVDDRGHTGSGGFKTASASINVAPPYFNGTDTAQLLSDPFKVATKGLIINGTLGNDVINVTRAGATYLVTINGVTQSFTGVTGRILVWGHDGNDTITVAASVSKQTWLSGGDGDDSITGGSGIDWISGGAGHNTLKGGAGIDRLVESADVDFTLVAGTTKVDGTLTAGTDSDVLYRTTIETAQLTGGAGNNTINTSAFAGKVTLDGGDGDDSLVSGKGNDSLIGGAGDDTLGGGLGTNTLNGGAGSDTMIGVNATTTWSITSNNGGKAGATTFTSVENLKAGSGNDTFKFSAGMTLSGALDGGGGKNTLNFAAYKTAVTVNLLLGTATPVTGGISSIRNVTGGAGNDILVGDTLANILNGMGGRDLLIGGVGKDTLNGGAGEDILVSGTTTLPTNLDLLMAEWSRTDFDYRTRIDDLLGVTTGGLNGTTLLNASSAQNDAAVDLLAGSSALDWFLASATDKILDFNFGGKETRTAV